VAEKDSESCTADVQNGEYEIVSISYLPNKKRL